MVHGVPPIPDKRRMRGVVRLLAAGSWVARTKSLAVRLNLSPHIDLFSTPTPALLVQ